MRIFLVILLLLSRCLPAAAAETFYPAPNGHGSAPVLVVYSSLDEPLARPMIKGFQKANPDVAVRYEEMLTGEVYDRVVKETDAGRKTADFAFSSAMDLQVKLSNDGYAQRSDLPMSDRWPQWANWRNTAYALTFEPAVFVYHKPSFRDEKPPASRAGFVDYLNRHGNDIYGRIGTYDISIKSDGGPACLILPERVLTDARPENVLAEQAKVDILEMVRYAADNSQELKGPDRGNS